jgi:hypothetical protein
LALGQIVRGLSSPGFADDGHLTLLGSFSA